MGCGINAGELRTAISFECYSKTSDGAGGHTTSWSEIAGSPTRAKVESLSGREQWATERVEARIAMRLTCRYSSLVTTKDRVVIRSIAYNIRAINNIGLEDRWMQVDLEGGVPA